MDRRACLAPLVVAVCLSCFGHNAAAQSNAVQFDNADNIIGVGLGTAPDYLGSSHYTFIGGPSGRLTFSGYRYVELFGPSLLLNVVDHEYFRAGPVGNYRFGRSDVEDATVARLRELDDTIELGGFVGFEFINAKNPRYRVRLNLEVLYDVGNEHGSYVATLGARYWMPLTEQLDIGVGSSITYAGGGYTNHYFGVSTADAARSGLPAYVGRSGLRDIQISPVLVLHLSQQWHLAGGMQYRRLLDNVANSPIVDQRGSADQFIGTLALAYSW